MNSPVGSTSSAAVGAAPATGRQTSSKSRSAATICSARVISCRSPPSGTVWIG
jgi:hypothetical protein